MKFYKIKTWKLKNGWLKINSKFKMQWISHDIGLSAIMIVIKIEKQVLKYGKWVLQFKIFIRQKNYNIKNKAVFDI